VNEGRGAERAKDAVRRGRRVFDFAYGAADTILDASQNRAFRFLWFFLPERTIAGERNFQALLVSKFLSDAGQQALAYGALIAVVRAGGSALDAALVGGAALLAVALIQISRRYGGHAPRGRLEELASFWQEPQPGRRIAT
jgi:hypothetical protein